MSIVDGLDMSDIVQRLRDNCVGYPVCEISWPHKILHEAADEIERLRKQSEWQDISTAPRDEMFIWAAPKGSGKWSLGLAYRNISGGWSDAYGMLDAPSRATHWCPLPPPPKPEA